MGQGARVDESVVWTSRAFSAARRSAATACSSRARSEHAELISLGIGEHDPRPLALSDVGRRGAKRKQPFDLNVSVVWPEVEVQPILDRLRLGDGDEEESRQTIRSGSNLELVGVVVDDYPTERIPPPPPEAVRIACIDDCLLPLEAHESIVGTAWPVCPKRRVEEAGYERQPVRGLAGS